MNQEQISSDDWGTEARENLASEIKVAELDKMLIVLKKLDDEYKEAKKKASEASSKYDAQEAIVMNALKALGKTSYDVPEVGKFSHVTKEAYRTPKTTADKELLFSYIERTYGKDSLMGMLSINSNSLNSWANEEAEKGVMQIPGLDLPTTTEYISIRKG